MKDLEKNQYIDTSEKEMARFAYISFLHSNNKIPSREAQAVYLASGCKQRGWHPEKVIYALLADDKKITAITNAANITHKKLGVAVKPLTNESTSSIIRSLIPYARGAFMFSIEEMEVILNTIYPNTLFDARTGERIPGGQWHFRTTLERMIREKTGGG